MEKNMETDMMAYMGGYYQDPFFHCNLAKGKSLKIQMAQSRCYLQTSGPNVINIDGFGCSGLGFYRIFVPGWG